MGKPQAAVIVFPGSNGDRDLFETFVRADFNTVYVRSEDSLPVEVAVAGLPGGFSYGDYWRAGMLASQAPAVRDLSALVERGGLVIGICNGFQILVEAGLLPGGLHYNDPPGFVHRWINVKVTPNDSPWFRGIEPGRVLHLPMANGEGRYVRPQASTDLCAPLVYVDNPNGSDVDTAAILDPTRRVLGIMPHPERASDPVLGSEDGLAPFAAARRYLEKHSL